MKTTCLILSNDSYYFFSLTFYTHTLLSSTIFEVMSGLPQVWQGTGKDFFPPLKLNKDFVPLCLGNNYDNVLKASGASIRSLFLGPLGSNISQLRVDGFMNPVTCL